MKKLITLCVLLLSVVVVQACDRAAAEPKPKAPRSVAMSMLLGTVDTLKLRATWQASTVGVSNGPVTYPLTWVRSGVTLRSATVIGLTDTIKIIRAPIGKADTVTFSVRALYTANGNMSTWASLTRFYINADLQFPTIPIIVTIDTL